MGCSKGDAPSPANMSPFLIYDWIVPQDLQASVKIAAEKMQDHYVQMGDGDAQEERKEAQGGTHCCRASQRVNRCCVRFGFAGVKRCCFRRSRRPAIPPILQ